MKSLYVDTKKIPGRYIDAFHQAKDLREDADYYNRWSEKGCQKLLKAAEEFLEKAKSIVK
jgi:uncharacterized protein (UPF0332 family)